MADSSDRKNRNLHAAVEKTVPADDFSAEGLRREMEQTSPDETPGITPQTFLLKTETENTPIPAEETTGLGGFGDTSTVAPKLIADQQQGGPRFRIVDEVGVGGTSRVYAVQDRSLNRTVALKLLRGKRAEKPGVERRFIHEARVTAMLEHPNVMPVHDIGTTDSGRVYFTMKNIRGVSLGDAIRAEKTGKPVPEIFQGLNGKIGIFLKVCDALSFAHDKGFVHQDVKPDNIMLGEYGEVLLLDWGCALSAADAVGADSGPVYGTPAYMSREQARREAVDERSDVYCLGATLFHALTLRHPTWDNDAERFWQKKREGVVDELAGEEIRRVPKALRAITMKALQPDPARRYQTVNALYRDLERFQAGQAVLAYRESPVEAFTRWYRRHRRIFWAGAAAAAVIIGIGGLLFREKLKEMLTWKLVFSEDFNTTTTAELPRRWKAVAYRNWRESSPDSLGMPGATWVVDSGTLYGVPPEGGGYDIACRHPIHGGLRVEWDVIGEVTAVNLNCFIGGADRRSGYTFHVGGFDSPGMVTLTRLEHDGAVDRAALPGRLVPNRIYRFRMERERNHVRFFVGGVQVIDYVDLDVLSGIGHQSFGFEVTRGNRVRIDNIRVYHHPLPRKVSPLAAPRQFENDGLYANALVRYRDLQRAYPGTDIAARAMFRAARCLQLMDSTAQALNEYAAFERAHPRHELVALAAFQRSVILTDEGRLEGADSVYAFLAEHYPRHAVIRTVVTDLSQRAFDALGARRDSLGRDYATDTAILAWCESTSRRVRHWLRAFDKPLAGNPFLEACADILLREWVSFHYDSVAARYGEQRASLADYLRKLGNCTRLMRDLPDQREEIAASLVEAGRYREVVDAYPDREHSAARALRQLGRYEDVLQRHPSMGDICAEALLDLGEARKVAEEYRDYEDQCAEALCRLGRCREAIDSFPGSSGARLAAVWGCLAEHYIRHPGASPTELAVFHLSGLHRYERAHEILVQQRSRIVKGHRSWLLYEYYNRSGTLERGLRSDELLPDGRWIRAMLDLGRYHELRERAPWNTVARYFSLRQQGHYDSCLTLFPVRARDNQEALLFAGRNDEVLSRFSEYPLACTQALLNMRRYDEVLDSYPEQRSACAEALVALGRYRDVVEKYPERDTACFKALALHRGEDTAFAAYPLFRGLYAQRLLQRDRLDTLIARVPDQTTELAIALTRLERRGEAPFDSGLFRLSRRGRHDVLSVWALRDWTSGKRARALEHLRARPPIYLRDMTDALGTDSHLRFGQFLLLPLLKAFDGDTAALGTVADSIAAHARYDFAQRAYYESAYLAGRIGDERFLAQPHGRRARTRLELLRALRDDVRGDSARSRETYVKLLDTPFPEGLLCSHAVRELLRWRVGREP